MILALVTSTIALASEPKDVVTLAERDSLGVVELVRSNDGGLDQILDLEIRVYGKDELLALVRSPSDSRGIPLSEQLRTSSLGEPTSVPVDAARATVSSPQHYSEHIRVLVQADVERSVSFFRYWEWTGSEYLPCDVYRWSDLVDPPTFDEGGKPFWEGLVGPPVEETEGPLRVVVLDEVGPWFDPNQEGLNDSGFSIDNQSERDEP